MFVMPNLRLPSTLSALKELFHLREYLIALIFVIILSHQIRMIFAFSRGFALLNRVVGKSF